MTAAQQLWEREWSNRFFPWQLILTGTGLRHEYLRPTDRTGFHFFAHRYFCTGRYRDNTGNRRLPEQELYETCVSADNFYLTTGSLAVFFVRYVSGALTTSPEDEFITIAPFFPEYRVFVEANGAKLVVVPPHTSDFQIDFDALEKAISIHTKGVIINSPNNPSGAVYSKETIRKLAALLTKKSEENGTPIFILADEPYREIAYDGVEVPYVTKYYANTLVCYSYSKSLSLPGERIGYVIVPDEVTESKTVYGQEEAGRCSRGP